MTTLINNVEISLVKSNCTYFIICKNLVNNNSANFNVGKQSAKAKKAFDNKVSLHS